MCQLFSQICKHCIIIYLCFCLFFQSEQSWKTLFSGSEYFTDRQEGNCKHSRIIGSHNALNHSRGHQVFQVITQQFFVCNRHRDHLCIFQLSIFFDVTFQFLCPAFPGGTERYNVFSVTVQTIYTLHCALQYLVGIIFCKGPPCKLNSKCSYRNSDLPDWNFQFIFYLQKHFSQKTTIIDDQNSLALLHFFQEISQCPIYLCGGSLTGNFIRKNIIQLCHVTDRLCYGGSYSHTVECKYQYRSCIFRLFLILIAQKHCEK